MTTHEKDAVTPPVPDGHAVYHSPFCRCGHKQIIHAGKDATSRCALRSCGCGRFEPAPVYPCCKHCTHSPDYRPDQHTFECHECVGEPKMTKIEQYGGHEFYYESHTDLFRCVRCHRYEVSARKDDGTFEPCAGEPPAGAAPIEVNAW